MANPLQPLIDRLAPINEDYPDENVNVPEEWHDIVLRMHKELLEIEPNYILLYVKREDKKLKAAVSLPAGASAKRYRAAVDVCWAAERQAKLVKVKDADD